MPRINLFRFRNFVLSAIVLMTAGCGNNGGSAAGGKKTGAISCATPEKITAVYKDYVYDMSAFEDVVGGTGFGLFDENAFVDPRALSPDDYAPLTNPHPASSMVNYFKDKGNRIVVDLRVPYKMSEIYLYDCSRATDSVWVYTGNMQQWKLSAAFATRNDPGQWGWRRFGITDSTRFVMFRFRSNEANITEAVMYGCALETPPAPPPATYTGPRLEPKMMKEFLGVNCFQETPSQFMKPFYYSRVYTYNAVADFDTTHSYPDIKYNITPHGWWNNGIQDYVLYADSMARMGNRVWYSFLGVPKFLELQGYNNENRPVNKIGLDTEDPDSYSRHANMFWNMAAAYGTTPVDTNRIQAWNEHRFSGRNVMTLYENGNESDAFWNGYKYCNPYEYFAQSSADYDGHEGRMGERHGIKLADANSELMMAGFTTLDVNRLRVLKFLCNTLRTDSQFLWKGGIQYHHYCSNGKGKTPADRFMNATGGSTPEEDSLRIKLSRIRDATYRIQPGVECFMGELGYDKSRGSNMSAPLVPGYSQSQSQGIMLLRAINAIAFSGFDRYIIYWIKDNSDENNPTLFLTSGILKQEANQQYTAYPAWFYISTLVNHLGNYVPEKIISEDKQVWIYKYRNKLSPDSAAYFIYNPSHNGSRTDNYSLQATHAKGTAAMVGFKDASVEGSVKTVPVNNGTITLNVTEVPQLVFVKE